MPADTELAILSRIIDPSKPELPAQFARLILRWKFSEPDRARMHELLEKAKAGAMTPMEKAEARKYERVGNLVSILKSKARRSLQAKRAVS